MKFIFSISILIISGALFFVITNPLYGDVNKLRKQVEVYNTALDNSKELQARRDELMKNYKSVKKADMERLESFLPNTVNNIKFVLEVERIANIHGMAIEGIKFESIKLDDTKDATQPEAGTDVISSEGPSESVPYGVFPVEFTTEGNYDTFISFLKDLEYNLRLVDVKTVVFTVPEVSDNKEVGPQKDPSIYKYNVKVETYWLK